MSHLQEVGAAHSGFTEGFLCGESITCASHFVCAIEKYNILVHVFKRSQINYLNNISFKEWTWKSWWHGITCHLTEV